MSSGKTPSKRTSPSSKKTTKPRANTQPGARAQRLAEQAAAAEAAERMRNDILGVVVAVVALALLIAVLSPGNAVLTNYVAEYLLLGLGIGAYIVPAALFLWGASFFARGSGSNVWRIGLGFLIIVVAFLGILAIYSPGAAASASYVFVKESMVARGGYLGAGIAWVLVKYVGQAIGTVILGGIMLLGVIVLGFSITSLVDKARDRISVAREQRAANARFDEQPMPESAAPRQAIRRGRGGRTSDADAADATEVMEPDAFAADDTVAFADDYDEPEKTTVLERPARKPSKRSVRKDAVEDAQPTVSLSQVAPMATPTALEGFELPPMQLLKSTGRSARHTRDEMDAVKDTGRRLQQTLSDFNLDAKVVGWTVGPTFTLFKVDMPAGVHVTAIKGLQDDITLALAAESVRVFAPIPGTTLVGIEVPNSDRAPVLLGDVLPGIKGGPLTLAVGKDVEGNLISADLAKMPHLLIGGATGSGKSVAINCILMSILMRATPAEVRMILIDPKRVELSGYNGIPHLFVPVVTNPKEASSVLAWATIEMDRRLKLFEKAGARDIGTYNAKVQAGSLEDAEEMPYMVIVIDELSDLMMVAGKEVEGSIVRIAQLARAAGIHLVVATQRPSADIVTGQIKSNIINRFAFKVASSSNSRIIIDQNGAEKLVGRGDMLFLKGEGGKPVRLQSCYVGDDEINAVVDALKEQGEPDYHEEILSTHVALGGTSSGGNDASDSSDEDTLLWEAADIVVSSNLGSTSNIQRRLRVGYARAGRIMDQLFEKGIVGPPDGSRPREVLVDEAELAALRGLDAMDEEDEE